MQTDSGTSALGSSERLAEFFSEFDSQAFLKSVIAALVLQGVKSVFPHRVDDMNAMRALIDFLDEEIDHLEASKVEIEDLLPMIELVNSLRSSGSGSFEGFESALSDLQKTMASRRNPWYEKIDFPIPASYAESYLASAGEEMNKLSIAAAKVFADNRIS